MMAMANASGMQGWNRWRVAGWSLAAGLLAAPLVAMQFDTGVNWTGFDFLFAAVLIGGVGGLFELAVRMSCNTAYRAGIAAALAAAFAIVWVNGAVGMIGPENNPYNLLFIGVIGVALAGALIARFRAAGMAGAMAAAAISQVCVAVAGMPTDLRGGLLSALFALPWLVSGFLFRKAARDQG